jgi:hypothetical protein
VQTGKIRNTTLSLLTEIRRGLRQGNGACCVVVRGAMLPGSTSAPPSASVTPPSTAALNLEKVPNLFKVHRVLIRCFHSTPGRSKLVRRGDG